MPRGKGIDSPNADEAERAMVRLEHDRWRALCAALLKAGAVTEEDLRRNARDLSTPGCELLEFIRSWGLARAALGAG